MPRAIYIASGTADAAAVAGAATFVGFSVRETAGTPAAATVNIRNGTSATDPVVAVINLAASGSSTVEVPAIDCTAGIFVDRITGSTELVIYVL